MKQTKSFTFNSPNHSNKNLSFGNDRKQGVKRKAEFDETIVRPDTKKQRIGPDFDVFAETKKVRVGPVPKSVQTHFDKTKNRKNKNLYNKKMKIDTRDSENDPDDMEVEEEATWASIDKYLQNRDSTWQTSITSTEPTKLSNVRSHTNEVDPKTTKHKSDSPRDIGDSSNRRLDVGAKETASTAHPKESNETVKDMRANESEMMDEPKKKKKNRRKKNKDRLSSPSLDSSSEALSQKSPRGGRDPYASGPVTPISSPSVTLVHSGSVPFPPQLSNPKPNQLERSSPLAKETTLPEGSTPKKLAFNFNKVSIPTVESLKSKELKMPKESNGNTPKGTQYEPKSSKKPKFVNDPIPQFDPKPSNFQPTSLESNETTKGRAQKVPIHPRDPHDKLPLGNKPVETRSETPREFEPRNPELRKRREELMDFRMKLPIYECKDALIGELKAHKSLVIIGETGSGKTTQIPQFIYDLNRKGLFKHQGIAITQPRRIAAITVAQRVSEEMGVPLGDLVGYHVRFDKKTSDSTKINFLTDGMLLREAMVDSDLKQYHTVVLDEAHERTLQTDILFGILKELQKRREAEGKKLNIVIMSATLDADLFEKYFNARVVYVQGRTYPVQIRYTISPEPNFIDATLLTILQIHLDEGAGDILAFLTGRYEIDSLTELIESRNKLLPDTALKMIPCPLFGAQTSGVQKRVFEATPKGTRKIVLATNIAETSVTVPNIKFVIDCGLVKAKAFDPRLGIDVLAVIPESHAQARQRAGRAGRTQAGICYRIFTEKTFLALPKTPIPEIYRISLSSVILTLKSIGIDNVLEFDYIERPPLDSFKRSLSELWILGALQKDGSLSELGRQMAMFPVEPQMAKCLILSKQYECSADVIPILAMLQTENLIITPSPNQMSKEDQKIFGQNLSSFASRYGDHLMLLRLHESYLKETKNSRKDWCKRNLINHKAMKKVLEVEQQLKDYWATLGWGLATVRKQNDPKGWSANEFIGLRKCFTASYLNQIAVLQPNGSYETLLDHKEVFIHPQSSMFQKKAPMVVYHSLVLTNKQYMRGVIAVDPDWVVELQPEFNRVKGSVPNNLKK